MAKDGKARGTVADERIDVSSLQELHSWSRALGITPAELKALVERVGPQAAAVRRAVSEGR